MPKVQIETMITKLYRRLQLILKPLKKGDVLFGDCSDFSMSTVANQIRHGLRSYDGTLEHSFWHGENTYRITILSASMPYYVLDGEVLTRKVDDTGQFVWMKRVLPNRIMKAKIEDMILTGRLKRSIK